MFAGHLAPALVLKKMERRLNLGWLFFAGLLHIHSKIWNKAADKCVIQGVVVILSIS